MRKLFSTTVLASFTAALLAQSGPPGNPCYGSATNYAFVLSSSGITEYGAFASSPTYWPDPTVPLVLNDGATVIVCWSSSSTNNQLVLESDGWYTNGLLWIIRQTNTCPAGMTSIKSTVGNNHPCTPHTEEMTGTTSYFATCPAPAIPTNAFRLPAPWVPPTNFPPTIPPILNFDSWASNASVSISYNTDLSTNWTYLTNLTVDGTGSGTVAITTFDFRPYSNLFMKATSP